MYLFIISIFAMPTTCHAASSRLRSPRRHGPTDSVLGRGIDRMGEQTPPSLERGGTLRGDTARKQLQVNEALDKTQYTTAGLTAVVATGAAATLYNKKRPSKQEDKKAARPNATASSRSRRKGSIEKK